MTKSTRRMARQPVDADTTLSSEGEVQPNAVKLKANSKIAAVITLLQREEGATIEEVAAATGWQKHTIRASLTGLKKKGHTIAKTKRDEVTCYRIAGGSMSMNKLNDQLNALERMTKVELSDRWTKLTGRPVPKVSPSMLRLALAYEMQLKALGGLSRKARQQLEQSAATIARDIRPGMRLARQFGGTVHVVTIGEQSEVFWNEREWRSLSEVARAITGTRWSGPAFFGLKDKRKAA